MIRTSYTAEDNKNTLSNTPLTRYRFVHWLCDVLNNFMFDPANIKDERLAKLLAVRTTIADPEYRNPLVQVGMPLSADIKYAGTTPAVFVTCGGMSYELTPLVTPALNTQAMTRNSSVLRRLGAVVSVITESADGTILLADTVEDFLVMNRLNLSQDYNDSINLKITGSSELQHIGAGQAGNAKDLYQISINLSAFGMFQWSTDVQGPVYRGYKTRVSIES